MTMARQLCPRTPMAALASVACLALAACANAPDGSPEAATGMERIAGTPSASVQLEPLLAAVAAAPGTLVQGRLAGSGFDLAVYAALADSPTGTAVYLHGYRAAVGSSGPAIAALLGAGWNVVAMDLPGHGKSGGERFHIEDFRDYSRALGFLVSGLGRQPRPLVLVGHSLGGAAIMGLLELDQTAADGAVLIAPLARIRAHFWASVGAFLARPFGDTLPGGVPASWFIAYRRWGERRWTEGEPEVPALLVICEDDTVVNAGAARAAVPSVARTEIVELAGLGHWEIDKQDSDPRLWGSILDFMNRLAGASSGTDPGPAE